MDFGLQGVEAFYSGFTPKIQQQTLVLARKHNLYVTAGSDYHGTNKLIPLAENNLASRKVLEKCGFVLDYEGPGPYHGGQAAICRYIFRPGQG